MREQEPITQTMKATEARPVEPAPQQRLPARHAGDRREERRARGGDRLGAGPGALAAPRSGTRRRFRALDESQAAFRDLPDEEVKREVGRALAEVRDENRRKAKRPANAK